uniref:Cecropin D n=1 Tax=Bombyx mori TaxID=7091 RepID=H7CHL2_BOMMO|nr:cecropin D [Bombyx mori]
MKISKIFVFVFAIVFATASVSAAPGNFFKDLVSIVLDVSGS